MAPILHSFLPCSSNRQTTLENFTEKEQAILKLFRTKFIISTNRIKVVKALTTQNGDQLFIATLNEKHKTRQVALQQLILSDPTDVNVSRLVKLFRRRRHLEADSHFVKPIGITVMRYQQYDALCLVLDWKFDMQNQTLTSYLRRHQISVSTQIQLVHDILTGIQSLVDRKVISKENYNLTAKHLFIDDGLNVKIAYYGIQTNKHDAGDAILGPNENYLTRLVWNVGMIIANISTDRNSPLRPFKAACLEENPHHRPKFENLIQEFQTIFCKRYKGAKHSTHTSHMQLVWSPIIQNKSNINQMKNPNITYRGPDRRHDAYETDNYDTDSTGVQL